MRLLIRRIATWLFVGVVCAIIVAVAAQWFIEVARDKGLFEDAGERWDVAMGVITEFATSGWVLYPLTALGGYVAGLWTEKWLRVQGDEKKDKYQDTTPAPAPPAGNPDYTLDVSSLSSLLSNLSKAGVEPGWLKVSFAAPQHDRVARTIKDAFTLAGWETVINDIPQERYSLEGEFRGVVVSGYNSARVAVTADALRQSGMGVVREKTMHSMGAIDGPEGAAREQKQIFLLIGRYEVP